MRGHERPDGWVPEVAGILTGDQLLATGQAIAAAQQKDGAIGWPDGHVDPDPGVQARRCWEIAVTALEELGGRVEDVVRTRQYLVRADIADAVGAAHGEIFSRVRPASTMIVVSALLDPRWLVEVELDAVVG